MARAAEGAVPNGSGATRQRILEEARNLFAQQGYAATSVRQIARRLGLSDPAVYYHFRTKRDLYEALLSPPDYGEGPLAGGEVSREAVISEALHRFNWWISQAELARVLFREQLGGEEQSLAFLNSTEAAWHDSLTVPLRTLVGSAAEDISATLMDLMSGLFWDALLTYGNQLRETVEQEFFQARLRMMADLAIPGPRAMAT